jgi:hypothetical protein
MQTETITTLENTLAEFTEKAAANAVLLESARQKIERAHFGVLEGKTRAPSELASAKSEESVFSDESTRLNAEIARVQAQIAAERRRKIEREQNDKLEKITRDASAALTLLESEFQAVASDLNCGLERIFDAATQLHAFQRKFIDEVRPFVPEVDWESFGPMSSALERETRQQLTVIKNTLASRDVSADALVSAWCGTAPRSYLRAVFGYGGLKAPNVPNAETLLMLLKGLERAHNRARAQSIG